MSVRNASLNGWSTWCLLLVWATVAGCTGTAFEELTKNADTTPPTIVATNPATGATAVAVNSVVQATFSEAMDAGTLSTATFTLKQGSTPVTGSVAYDAASKTVTFSASANLANSASHAALITSAVKDAAGNAMVADYAWSFTTVGPDTTAPTVASTSPANGATSVSLTSAISVTFSEAMDITSITANTTDTTCSGSLQVSSDDFASCVRMGSAPTASGGNATFTVTPAASLTPSLTYKIRVTTAAKDTAANALGTTYTTAGGFATITLPTIVSVSSVNTTTIRVTFSSSVTTAEAQTAANYKVYTTASLTGTCATNASFGFAGTEPFTVTNSAGSGAVYDLTLSGAQTTGTAYTVAVDKSAIHDAAGNAIGCPNNSDFTGNETLKVVGAQCKTTTQVIVTLSKAVKVGNDAAGTAGCTSNAQCANRYLFAGVGSLGNFVSAAILDGTVCGSEPANSAKVCVTHATAQTGGHYTITVANNVDGDGFNNSGWGGIEVAGGGELVQASPNDRATFKGCGATPSAFTDGPMSVDPFGDGTSFGSVTSYNSKLYIGPNNTGNGATRFDPDGSNPQSVTFSFAKDTTGNQSRNTAATRDGGIAVPPYVSIGHGGCTVNGGDIATACGPDNENGRGLFGVGTFAGIPYIFLGGARTAAATPAEDLNYIYYTGDTDAGLDFKYVDMSAFNAPSAQGFSSLAVMDDRLYAGIARDPSNRPDFGRVSFKTSDTNKCTAGSSCDAANGLEGVRLNIHRMDNFGGTATAGVANWAFYVGVDSLIVFNSVLYAGNGGHPQTNHDGGLIRSNSANPAVCTDAAGGCAAPWTEVAPRGVAAWNNSGNRFSLELQKTSDLIPADRAFPAFAEYNGRLYAIRNTCTRAAYGAAADGAGHTEVGCTDGTYTNRSPQLWKCDPTLTSTATTCETGDWTLVGDDSTGITNFGSANSHSATLLIVNGAYLYVGFDNATNGVRIYRTNVANPGTNSSDWGQIGTDGLGDATNNQQIYSTTSVQQSADYYLYVVTGKSSVPARVFRQQNN